MEDWDEKSFGSQDNFSCMSGISTADLATSGDSSTKYRENNVAQALWAHLDPFVYDDYTMDCTLQGCETRDIIELQDGSQYQGDWLRNTDLRQGRGH